MLQAGDITGDVHDLVENKSSAVKQLRPFRVDRALFTRSKILVFFVYFLSFIMNKLIQMIDITLSMFFNS